MKIGFIGAGRAGCSLGKYLETKRSAADVQVTGYYSLLAKDARWAADFTNSTFYDRLEDIIAASDSVILSTPDGAIKNVWETIPKDLIDGRMICHLSGSLSSDVFSGIDQYGAYGISIHPLIAFSDKESVYQQLNEVSFTLEGHDKAVKQWKDILTQIGNSALVISKEVKPMYHAAASILSNHVVAVLQTGYELLQRCGFSEEDARKFSSVLVQNNVSNVISEGAKKALTGPIERADIETVRKHLSVLNEKEQELYRACGNQLIHISQEKNPKQDYSELKIILKG